MPRITMTDQPTELTVDELFSRYVVLRNALREYRLADRELCNLEVTTREAFARLHAAEDAVDDLLGLARIGRKERP